MRILSADHRPAHLSYCTNVHPGEDWDAHFAELRRHVPGVRYALAAGRPNHADEPFGLGLRLSARALDTLETADAFARFRRWLDEERCYVFTVNGFPYGPFHGTAVKENVYRPDWSELARLDYTCRLATLLARLDPPDGFGSISTLPGTFAAWNDPAREAAIADNLLRAVAHCVALERRTGTRIALAIEPEPCCLLETAEETARFFETRLLSTPAVQRLATLADLSAPEARRAIRRHVGVCHDVCHSAVEFECSDDALGRYAGAGIEVVKLQLSSALRIEDVNESALRQLARFDEPVYLHQVVERRGEELIRHTDLGAAMDAARHRLERRSTLDASLVVPRTALAHGNGRPALPPISEPAREWRVHFHVPVFLERAGAFSTTRDTLERVLTRQRETGIARHLEVETYTWDVLPAELRDVEPAVAIARELDWVRERL